MNGWATLNRRPGTAEGIRYNGTNAALIADGAGHLVDIEAGRLVLHTPQGDMTPEIGNWVILVDGECYPITTRALTRGWEVIG